MTPGIRSAKKAGIKYQLLEYDHDPRSPSYGGEAVEKMGVDPTMVFKTLVVEVDGSTLVVCVIAVPHRLDLKLVAKEFGGKRAKMAEQSKVERTTGYLLGGVSPLGQKKKLKTLIDRSALDHDLIHVSGGRRGLEIVLNPGDLAGLVRASFASIVKPER